MAGLKIERKGHVLRVTLARPERRNAFDAALIAKLTEAFADVGDARAVVLAGEGPSFCAGADVEWQRAAIDLSYDENVEDALRLYRMMEAIDSCPAPVVVRVHGYALGGGSGLVACADVALASEDAVFGFSEVKLGIIPAVVSTFALPKIGAAVHAGHERSRRRGRRGAAGAPLVGAGGGAGGEAPRPRAPRRRGGGARRGAAADEPRRAGGAAGVPREAARGMAR